MSPKRTRQSNIRSTNVNFTSASIPSSIVNNTTTFITSAAAAVVVTPTFTSGIPQASAIVPTVPDVISPESTNIPITIPPITTLFTLITSAPDITSLAHNIISSNENNNEFVDELMNLLTNNQNDEAANNFNNQTLIRQVTGMNIVRPRERRINRTEMLAELEVNYTRRAIFEIISRYFNSSIVSYSITNRLYNLEVGDMITLNALIKTATSSDRPARASQIQLMDELIASNIFIITQPKQNVVQIRKNNDYIPPNI